MSFEWVEKNASNYENKRNITTKMNIWNKEKKYTQNIHIRAHTFLFKSLPKK